MSWDQQGWPGQRGEDRHRSLGDALGDRSPYPPEHGATYPAPGAVDTNSVATSGGKTAAAKQVSNVPGGGGLLQAVSEEFSTMASVGGVQGVLEAIVPLTVYSVAYAVNQFRGVPDDANLKLSAGIALGLTVLFVLIRLVRKQSPSQAISGVFWLGVGVFIASRTGRAEDAFIPTIVKNVAFGAMYLLSIVVRWPVVGVFLGLVLQELTYWRQVPQRYSAYVKATWVWVAVFALRAAVQIPLHNAGTTAGLGLANVILGLPLFVLAIWMTWAIVRKVPVARPPTSDLPASQRD